MSRLKERLGERIETIRDEAREIVDAQGDRVLSEVTVKQAYGGMRGVKGLICDTSEVDPEDGLRIRGIPVRELAGVTAEECFFLLVVGERPSDEERESVRDEWKQRGTVPDAVFEVIEAFPEGAHPMSLFSAAVLALQQDSEFARAYDQGMRKEDHWIPALEDAMNLIARLPAVAAGIYSHAFGKGERRSSRRDLDWGADFAHLLGVSDPDGRFAELIRMFAVLHSDHEGGNVSAHAATVVGSALADPYRSFSAGMNGLAGPLHGLANQEALRFVREIHDRFDGVPAREQLRGFCRETLDEGRVIPGYGHAVLRCPDPRFTALVSLGERICPQSDSFRIVRELEEVVPEVLRDQGKAKNPWPNVDAVSGSLLHHFGLTEMHFYTVLFGVSRALGICAQQVIARVLGLPLERPKSVGAKWIRESVAGSPR